MGERHAVVEGTSRQGVTLAVGGLNCALEARGEGEPVLFLHGASTVEGFDFADADLSVRWLLPHHPGFGGTPGAAHLTSPARLVAHYLRLLDVLGLDRVGLCGFSMGGWVAALLAIAAPDRIDRLCLIAPAGLAVASLPPTDLAAIAPEHLPFYLTHKASVGRRYFPEQPSADFLALRQAESLAVARLTGGRPMLDPGLQAGLAAIRCPVLVVWGERDRMHPVDLCAHWLEGLPAARSLLIPEAGHFVLQDQPRSVAAIASFMQEPTDLPAAGLLPDTLWRGI